MSSGPLPPKRQGCSALMLPPQRAGGPLEYGLATCSKYNTSPPRGIPEKGQEICAQPGSSPATCWMDFYACRRANIAERAYQRSFLGQHDPAGEPQVAEAARDAQGRAFYCLQRNGQWVHSGDHDFPVGGK